ncbi:MAG TPA: hypothetical protein VGA49_02390 [Patescibacteria group bacterium]
MQSKSTKYKVSARGCTPWRHAVDPPPRPRSAKRGGPADKVQSFGIIKKTVRLDIARRFLVLANFVI